MMAPVLIFGKETELSIFMSSIIILGSIKSSLSFLSKLRSSSLCSCSLCRNHFKKKPKQNQKPKPSLLPFSGPFQILMNLRDLFRSEAGTAFRYVHHFTYIYITFHLSFYCPVTQSFSYLTVCPCPTSLNNFVSSAYFLTFLLSFPGNF